MTFDDHRQLHVYNEICGLKSQEQMPVDSRFAVFDAQSFSQGRLVGGHPQFPLQAADAG